ncbi:response regulator transcription factor [Desulforamulus aeronauticus]|uniref:Stage 0 sporulation protein A homolog n=1 Tax=Desulforamulus aeronauticus DSM 10349 TaxID=1121421 RepID=A0A1M6X344_9FIRM|nr:response regulator transcription factor [Desulforamulus aeronauticus]MCL4440519.1 response regulator transcription factor [Bacillota bacterium]SHK70176.1 DNA-binding response regulator, OmpR family, contains REC and winged-helix (wHTH) domain [Desulforamulus aeronauticus DSM 10349]SHK90263.1 DNA-binding response regulator, OmpR family, contains REC and winged-helix (wHTH) domain [Desulforamulus aeronauticus DSM 10349]SHL00346.1 DNA-binding response regulator, OmpR family, contains REC and wi
MGRILVIEDDKNIQRFVTMELTLEGYEVASAYTGREGLKKAVEEAWDLILLDIMLPELSGLEVCRRIRQVKNTPILMLTARAAVPDKIAGLDSGANDYITKPFSIEELLARVRVYFRENKLPVPDDISIKIADLTINLRTREVTRNERKIELTPREFNLLQYFAENQRTVLSRDQLLQQVWGYDYYDSNVVDVYVRYLRNKIEFAQETKLIHTVRGVGYVLEERSLEN